MTPKERERILMETIVRLELKMDKLLAHYGLDKEDQDAGQSSQKPKTDS